MGGIGISNSEAKLFTDCRRKFYYARVKNLEAKSKVLPLARGSWMHKLFEAYFIGKDWGKVHKKLCKEFEDELTAEEYEALAELPAECERMMDTYEWMYFNTDRNLDVIATELVLEIPIIHGHTYQATLDVVFRDELGLWIMDHKTLGRYPSANAQFTDAQTARYAFAAYKHFGEMPIGIVWDYVITKPPTKPRVVKDGSRLYAKKVNTDLHTYVKAIKEYGLDPYDYKDKILELKEHNPFYRRDYVPVVRPVVTTLVKELIYIADEIERGFKPVRSLGKHCDWCQFQPLCIADLQKADSGFIERTQYKPRERRYGGTTDEEEA
jgi:hypothetical protein